MTPARPVARAVRPNATIAGAKTPIRNTAPPIPEGKRPPDDATYHIAQVKANVKEKNHTIAATIGSEAFCGGSRQQLANLLLHQRRIRLMRRFSLACAVAIGSVV